jgi:hypothetical protein
MLREYELPYFHMSECNAHKGIFQHLDKESCDQCARKAIELARAHPLHGHVVIIDQSDYRKILQENGFSCDPYTFLSWTVFVHVNKWVHENRPDEKISLFFEAGYKAQSKTNELLQLLTNDDWGGKNRVVRNTFVGKEDSGPCQAADLISWQVRSLYQNDREGRPPRRDTIALLEDKKNLTIYYTAERLEAIRGEFQRLSGSLENATRSMYSLEY